MHRKRSTASRRLAAFPLRSLTIALFAGPATAEILDLSATGSPPSASSANGISGDGGGVVGQFSDTTTGGNDRAFRWTEAGGMEDLGLLGGTKSIAYGASNDGSVIVGSATGGVTGANEQAFRWTAATGMVGLGTLGGTYSVAYGVSADGSTVVGSSATSALLASRRAFLWTAAGGMENLGSFNGGLFSAAYGASSDGSVVVGTSSDGALGNAKRAFRWTRATGLVRLNPLNGGTNSYAHGISGDGSVIAGFSDDGASGNAQRAFRWTAATGMVSLGTLNGGATSQAFGISLDGNVIVGGASDGADGNRQRAFRWTQATGMQSVEQWLRSNGVPVGAGLATKIANGTSRDGSVVVGQLENGRAFFARLGTDDGGTGLIDIEDYNRTLQGAAHIPAQAIAQSDLVLHGLHGSPMRGLPAAGQRAVWVGGDWGRQENPSGNGDVGNGEFGIAVGLTDRVQLKAAVGKMHGEQSLIYSGRVRVHSAFVMPEAIVALPGTPLRASASGYYSVGEADVRRGYQNAGTPVASSGSPQVETAGLRLRLDWLDAVRRGDFRLTPYTSITRYWTRVEGYKEQGGGFPVRWDERNEQSTFSRVGADASYALNSRWRLLGRLEAVRRLEARGTDANGTILGLNTGFSFGGLGYKRDWMRAAAGVEGRLGRGIASLMLNASTETNGPAYWAHASYRLAF